VVTGQADTYVRELAQKRHTVNRGRCPGDCTVVGKRQVDLRGQPMVQLEVDVPPANWRRNLDDRDGTLRSIIRTAEISVEEFIKLVG
jgi:hypothetical protein